MAVTHTWSIIRLEQLNDGTETVTEVFYNVLSEDEISCNSSGGVQLNIDNIENFIQYQNLTEETLLGWVKEQLGENLGNHEINNAAWIDSVKNPPAPRTISQPLPWTV
jgi:tRNA/tmRNA/rRNA uracil-C5-methylase (TrmA/RlmC/RlmD family)